MIMKKLNQGGPIEYHPGIIMIYTIHIEER
jgi:hypothetical protein